MISVSSNVETVANSDKVGPGTCLARAVLSADIREGVVAIPTGAWFDPDEDGNDNQGNPNVLTPDTRTSRNGQQCS
jgi:biotin/methionine sulfoxide reductase